MATNVKPGELSLPELLARHPWPDAYAADKKIERLWTFDLPCKPEMLWPFIADSSRMNRALGTAEMTFVERDGKRYGSSKAGGVKHEWLEVPWNWIAEQWLTCTRIYDKGFMKVMFAIHRLDPTPNGTRLYLYFGAVPRGAFGGAALRLGFPTLERAYRRVLPELAKQLGAIRPAILELPPPSRSTRRGAGLDARRTSSSSTAGFRARPSRS